MDEEYEMQRSWRLDEDSEPSIFPDTSSLRLRLTVYPP